MTTKSTQYQEVSCVSLAKKTKDVLKIQVKECGQTVIFHHVAYLELLDNSCSVPKTDLLITVQIRLTISVDCYNKQ